jgi:hypothetical protein
VAAAWTEARQARAAAKAQEVEARSAMIRNPEYQRDRIHRKQIRRRLKGDYSERKREYQRRRSVKDREETEAIKDLIARGLVRRTNHGYAIIVDPSIVSRSRYDILRDIASETQVSVEEVSRILRKDDQADLAFLERSFQRAERIAAPRRRAIEAAARLGYLWNLGHPNPGAVTMFQVAQEAGVSYHLTRDAFASLTNGRAHRVAQRHEIRERILAERREIHQRVIEAAVRFGYPAFMSPLEAYSRRDLIAHLRDRGWLETRSKESPARRFLREAFKGGGSRLRSEVVAEGAAVGIGESSLRLAFKRLGGERRKIGPANRKAGETWIWTPAAPSPHGNTR